MPGFASRPAYPSKLLSLDLLRPFVLEKDEWFRTDSGTSYRLSKNESLLSCRKHCKQLQEYAKAAQNCQQGLQEHSAISTGTTALSERHLGSPPSRPPSQSDNVASRHGIARSNSGGALQIQQAGTAKAVRRLEIEGGRNRSRGKASSDGASAVLG
jgi:hypothetical protein